MCLLFKANAINNIREYKILIEIPQIVVNKHLSFDFTRKSQQVQDLFYMGDLVKVAAVQNHSIIKCNI